MARNPRVHIIGDWDGAGVKRAQQDLGIFQRQAAGFSGAISKSFLGIGAAVGGALAVGSLVSVFKDAASAAMEDEQSVTRLSTAMSNLGLASKTTGVEALISKFQMLYGVSDTELRGSFQKLATATGDLAESQNLLQLALDISAGSGRDLASVTQALSRASQGSMTALTRLGVPLDAGIVKSKDFGAAVAALSQKFGGQAKAASETYAGSIKRISEGLNEVKEAAGYGLLDGFTGGTKNATKSADQITAQLIQMQQQARAFGEFMGSAAAIALGAFDMVRGSVTIATYAIVQAFNRMYDASINLSDALGLMSDEQAQHERDTQAAIEAEQEQAYQEALLGYQFGSATVALDGKTTALGENTDATDSATDATTKLVTVNDLLKASLDRIASRDDVTTALRGIAKAARDAKGDLLGNSEAAIGLRAQLGSAATAALNFAQTTGTSTQQVYDIFTSKVDAMKTRLVNNGVDAKDAERWVNKAVWMAQFTLLADSIGKGPAASAMRYAGLASGRQLWKGIVQGLAEGNKPVFDQGAVTAAQAAAGARYAAQINSPSRVFREIGLGLTEGLSLGMKDGTKDAVDAAAKMIAEIARAAGDALQKRKDMVASAVDAVKGVSDGIVSQVLGNLNFATMGTDAEGKAVPLTPQQIVQMMFGDMAKQQQVVDTVAAGIGKNLPPELLSQILSMPPDTAIALADYLGANPAMLAELAGNYQALSDATTTELGIPMGLAWAKVGDQSAKSMLAAARDLIRERKDTFSQWVANQLAVEIPVSFSNPNLSGARANGGPVSAGGAYLVGERGPEVFVPSVGGSIVPNGGGSSPSAGNSYSITVQAGVGDPRQIGQQVVELIRKFEKANGPVWASA